jgi:hypothetical protein
MGTTSIRRFTTNHLVPLVIKIIKSKVI